MTPKQSGFAKANGITLDQGAGRCRLAPTSGVKRSRRWWVTRSRHLSLFARARNRKTYCFCRLVCGKVTYGIGALAGLSAAGIIRTHRLAASGKLHRHGKA